MNPNSEVEQGKTLVGKYLTETAQTLNLTLSEVEWQQRFYEKDKAAWALTFRVSDERCNLDFAVSELDTLPAQPRDPTVEARVRDRIRHALSSRCQVRK